MATELTGVMGQDAEGDELVPERERRRRVIRMSHSSAQKHYSVITK